jgi:RHS repeat-associated protein
VALTDGTGKVWSVYDGVGQRVATISNGSISAVMVYDAGGKLVAEYGAQSSQTGGTQYVFSDHRGSTRVVTNQTGAVISRQDYEPFGGELGAVGVRSVDSTYGGGNSVRQKYAEMEQDDGSGMSHTLWRKYDRISGRWTSPDPYGESMSVSDPQSFNRYTYVNNDPVNLIDPLGLMSISSGGNYSPQDLFKWAEGQALFASQHVKPKAPTRIGNSPQEGSQTTTRQSAAEDEPEISPEDIVKVDANFCQSCGDFIDPDGNYHRGALPPSSIFYDRNDPEASERARGRYFFNQNPQIMIISSIAGGAFGSALGGISRLSLGAASRAANRLPPVLFHYADDAAASLVNSSGQIGRPGALEIFFTNKGNFSPAQARELLALPSWNNAGSLFAVDTQVLSKANLLRSGFVPPYNNRLGGGFQFVFSQPARGNFTQIR